MEPLIECLNIVLLQEEYGGIHKKNTPAVKEIQVDDIFQLHCAFFMLANKYERKLNEGQILWKVEKDSSYSKLVVSAAHPAMFKFSKNLEIMRFTARYGHFNRHGVPQHPCINTGDLNHAMEYVIHVYKQMAVHIIILVTSALLLVVKQTVYQTEDCYFTEQCL